MSEVIKLQRNIFIDSETNQNIDSTQVSVNLTPNDFCCGSNEEMRISLTSFEMRNNWYNINQYNNTFWLFTPTTPTSVAGVYNQIQITPSSYYDFINSLYIQGSSVVPTVTNVVSTGLSEAIQTALLASSIGTGHTCTYNPNTRKLQIVLNTGVGSIGISQYSYFVCFGVPPSAGGTVPTGVSNVYTFSDTNEILGGNNNIKFPTTSQPISALGSSVYNAGLNTLTSESPYVAQLNSIEAIYLRSNLQSLNYSTYAFAQSVFQNSVTGSSIFARIPLLNQIYNLNDPFLSFEDTNDLFTIEIGNKQLDNITIYITDDKNRPLPLVGVGQVTSGMLSFKLSLKWEVVLKDSASPFIPTLENVRRRLINLPIQP